MATLNKHRSFLEFILNLSTKTTTSDFSHSQIVSKKSFQWKIQNLSIEPIGERILD
jgi:hypothetical protein